MAIRRGYIILFLIFVTIGIYYPSIFGEVNPVDDVQIINSYLFADRFDIKSLFVPGKAGYYYRPLLGLTFIFDKIAWEMRESFLHLENILLHAINVILVFLVSEKVSKHYSISNRSLPLVAALLFAVHPIATESVNWIAGRTDLLAGLFLLLSLLLLITSLERHSQILGVVGVASFFLACMSKEVAVAALPGLLCIVLFYDQQGALIERIRLRWASAGSLLLVVFGFSLLLLRFSLLNGSGKENKLFESTLSLSTTLSLVLTAFGFYGKKLFFPWPLNFAIVHVSGYYIIIGIILLAVILYISYKRTLLSALVLICVCLILPPLLISVISVTWTPLAERYLYLPCIMFCIFISTFIYKLIFNEQYGRSKYVPFLVVCLLIILSVSTVNRNIVWQNNISLFNDTLINSPNFYLAQNALMYSLKEKGRFDESRALMMSIKAPENSKRGGKLIDSNQAMILVAQGDYHGAKALLLRNIENSGVMYTRILENLVTVNQHLIGVEKNENIIHELQGEIVGYLLKIYEKTGDPFYFYRLGQFYLGIGNKSEAQKYFSKASILSSDGAYYKAAANKLAEKLKQ